MPKKFSEMPTILTLRLPHHGAPSLVSSWPPLGHPLSSFQSWYECLVYVFLSIKPSVYACVTVSHKMLVTKCDRRTLSKTREQMGAKRSDVLVTNKVKTCPL